MYSPLSWAVMGGQSKVTIRSRRRLDPGAARALGGAPARGQLAQKCAVPGMGLLAIAPFL